MDIQKRYESETGEAAIYRKGSSDYHTLRYVKWLAKKAGKQRQLIEQAHMAGQADAGIDPGYSNAQEYANKVLNARN